MATLKCADVRGVKEEVPQVERGTIVFFEDHGRIHDEFQRNDPVADLGRAGYNVLSAESAEEAARLIDEEKPALFVVDMSWAIERDASTRGVELARRYRKTGLPVLVIRGVDQAKAVPDDLEFLDDPWQPSALLDKVERLVG